MGKYRIFRSSLTSNARPMGHLGLLKERWREGCSPGGNSSLQNVVTHHSTRKTTGAKVNHSFLNLNVPENSANSMVCANNKGLEKNPSFLLQGGRIFSTFS